MHPKIFYPKEIIGNYPKMNRPLMFYSAENNREVFCILFRWLGISDNFIMDVVAELVLL
jgi:hypothetical protein